MQWLVGRYVIGLSFALLTCILSPLNAYVAAQDKAAVAAIPNAGLEEGEAGESPLGWGGTVQPGQSAAAPVYAARIDPENPRRGRNSVRLEHVAPPVQEGHFGVVSNSLDARLYRGRRIRLTGAVRTEEPWPSHVGLWLRVDREQGRRGFFDNMSDRPIRSGDWADYVIEGDVAADADRLVFGLVLVGGGKAWLDDVRLEDVGPARTAGGTSAGAQRPRTIAEPGDDPPRALDSSGRDNLRAFARAYGIVRYFHPSDEAAAADWDSIALAGVEEVEGAQGPAALAQALNRIFTPVAPSFQAFVTGETRGAYDLSTPATGAKAVRWRRVGYGSDPNSPYSSERIDAEATSERDILTIALAGGVTVRVPLVVWRDSGGFTLPRATGAALRPDKAESFIPSGLDRTTRLAAVVSAWNVFQHFYPYFDVVRVDWSAELDRALDAAATDPDDLAFHATLNRLVAALQDGHGRVFYETTSIGRLPIAWDDVEGRLVVAAVAQGVENVVRGDIVTHVGGRPAAQALADQANLVSGSPQWVGYRARNELLGGIPGGTVELRLTRSDGTAGTVQLPYREIEVEEQRPETGTELAPGLVYVNLDGLTEADYRRVEPRLAAARGLIFDLRGYPAMGPIFIARLADRPVQSAHFMPPVLLRPDLDGVEYPEGGWDIPPVAPRFTPHIAFIADESAISYSESILGLVAANRLAEIVGEPTAGANGNVAVATVPGGYRLGFTAMRVVNRDGSQHHLHGVQPTVPVNRSLSGVRAGRDELLERAVAVVTGRMETAPAR